MPQFAFNKDLAKGFECYLPVSKPLPGDNGPAQLENVVIYNETWHIQRKGPACLSPKHPRSLMTAAGLRDKNDDLAKKALERANFRS